MTDEAILLGFPNQRLMHKLRQLHLRKLSEGSGKRGLMRHLLGRIPAADPPQLSVLRQSLQQLARRRKPVHGFGHERTRDSVAVLARPTDLSFGTGDEARQTIGSHLWK